MDKQAKIYVAGHRGMVGSAICRYLQGQGYSNLLLAGRETLDLCRQAEVEQFVAQHAPEYVIIAAARVGGIHANSTYPAEFIRDNIQIATNLVDASYRAKVKKVLFLGSSCIYPKLAPQPMTEDCLLTGALEPTNQWYAIAKIAGIKLCQAYREQYGFNAISAMPTNLYGPEDNFHDLNAHVIPALIARFHQAKLAGQPSVMAWGTGSPRREFLHVDDLAEAVIHLLDHYEGGQQVNVGTGQDVTIKHLTELVAQTVGYMGEIVWDSSKPDGTPRKLLDISKIEALGWSPKIDLAQGLQGAYQWYLDHIDAVRMR
ncbi:NAD-dependent epimerase/dehydratase [Magnetococcus marinus MC-1]|uniref:GDP-L-fucose synthase n=1 Tax=Magnetococcus marinus (strain ATCC BAA-1437 / JCM 17883 / MC-1) TaxID=156889 RepID=A0LCW1_MAGMM|nr:GDP-L-fucose synthase [Magnetococcus marinus]ABK45804.1 NAD-dependent epimerase/dehydratase [Magnetococcus marinus MC-1]